MFSIFTLADVGALGLRRRGDAFRFGLRGCYVSTLFLLLFALSKYFTGKSDEAGFRSYISEFFLPNASSSLLDRLAQLYPADPTQGSPYDTGTANAITPEFKRIASFLGDYVFIGPRRFLTQNAGGRNNWSFCTFQLHRCNLLLD